jgi:TRAP transporter TAXI family solute receptor
MRFPAVTIAVLALTLTSTVTASAQVTDPNKAARDRVNESTVFIAGGSLGATYNALANDIGLVTSDDKLRVVSVTTSTGVQNVRDLVFLRSIDLAFTNVRVLNGFAASGELGPNLKRQIVYVAPLTTEEAHVLVQPEINSLEDLKGKRVSFHIAGSSSALAGTYIFQALGITVQVFNFPQPEAVEKMRQKELDATVCICPKVVPAYTSIKPEAGFKFIEVPYPQALEAEFLPGKLTGEDYPNLMAKDKKVQTVAMNTILVTLNWPKGSMRYNRNAKFVDAFFSRAQDFLRPPRQAAWKTVNLAGTVPGWQRFAPAQEWLDRNREQTTAQLRTRFDKFLDEQTKRGDAPAPQAADRERLFREFQDWMRRN